MQTRDAGGAAFFHAIQVKILLVGTEVVRVSFLPYAAKERDGDREPSTLDRVTSWAGTKPP